MYKLYDRKIFVGECETLEEIEVMKKEYQDKVREKTKPEWEQLEKIKELLQTVYGRRKCDTPETYLDFIKKFHPEVIVEIEKYIEMIDKEVIRYYIDEADYCSAGIEIPPGELDGLAELLGLDYVRQSFNDCFLELMTKVPNEKCFRIEEVEE